MSKMIIYFCLLIPLLFLPADASSIRGRNHKNDLVPFLSSRLDTLKKDPNSIKVVSKEPFIIQLQMPNSKEMEARGDKEKDNKRKRPLKKRISKTKPLRKKQRRRRDLLTLRTKPREEKIIRLEIPRPANKTEKQIKNITRNSFNRMEILKALSTYPKRAESKRNKDEAQTITKKNNTPNRNLPKHNLPLSDRTKMTYPTTPKLDRPRYTYKDLMADRERLEQKIKYIKNMLNVNDSITDDAVRVRRRSDSDRTANKIAKMFLTLSAVNGLHDRKKSKCDDDDDDRVEDVWEKERRNNPLRKSTSSNEERYKVKKWIEFMKNKRSSGKTCPCMGNVHGEDSDAFPLEQKLPKGYFLLERGRSSEESSESYRDPFYYSKDKTNKNDNVRKRLSKTQDQDGKTKALSKNGKKILEVPFEDLELYRSRARQILQNAEEILDKIKEEEEKRLASPNILMSQLKELTSRIHGDPRNNENDLIRKIQKNLGWAPLTRPQDNADGTFLDNVKSFILDPYEKAKALTDESTKKLSSYLLRNLGRLQDSSEEQETRNADDENLKVYFGEVPHREELPSSASLAREEPPTDGLSKSKEELQNWEDTLSAILGGGDDTPIKENREEPSQDFIKETQQKLNDHSKQPQVTGDKGLPETSHSKQILAESKPGSVSEEERVAMKFSGKETDENNPVESQSESQGGIKSAEDSSTTLERTGKDSEVVQNQKFRGTEGTFQGENGETKISDSRDMPEEEEFKKEIEEIIKSAAEKKYSTVDEEAVQSSKIDENEKNDANEDTVAEMFDIQEENEKENEKVGVIASPEVEESSLKEEEPSDLTADEKVEKTNDVSSPTASPIEPPSNESGFNTPSENEQNSKEIVRADLEEDKSQSNEEPVLQKELKQDQKAEENTASSENIKNTEEETEKESPIVLESLLKESEKEDSPLSEVIESEISTKTQPEHLDLVQETKQSSKELDSNPTEGKPGDHQSGETPVDENKMEKVEMVHEENEDEEPNRKEGTNDENVEAILDNEKIREITDNIERSSLENQNTPLRASLEKQENLNEPSDDDNKSSSKETDDGLVKETNPEDQQKETQEEDIKEETVNEAVENKSREILGVEKDPDASSSAEEPMDDMENQSKAQTDNEETMLKESNPDEDAKIPLKAVKSNEEDPNSEADDPQEHVSSEVNKKDANSGSSNEMYLKASLEEDENSEKDDGMTVKAENPNEDEKNDQIENVNKDQETLESAKSTEDVGIQKGSLENDDDEKGSETLDDVQDTQGELAKEVITSVENQNGEKIDVKEEETIVKAKKPDENLNTEDKETNQELEKSLNSQEMETLREIESEENLREANPDEDVQYENSENDSYETLKAIPDNQNQESAQVNGGEIDQGELDSDKPGEDDNLEAVLETQENIESPDETLKAVKLDDGFGLSQEEANSDPILEKAEDDEALKDDLVLKEVNTSESEYSLRDNDDVGAAIDNQEEQIENGGNFDGNERKIEDVDDERMLLRAENFEDYDRNENPYDETLRALSEELENLEGNYERVQVENPAEYENEKEADEASLRSASFEDEFDNKIEDENPLQSVQSLEEMGLESIKDADEDGGETLRAEKVSHDLSNQIDEENEDEAILKSVHFDDESPDNLNEDSYDTRLENLETLKASNWGDENLHERGSITPVGDFATKSLKASKLKVPESIGKIMKDLDGKEKSDITSMQSLNPDKIDHMLGKIGEAEQQNLLESDELDCRKECACAEEMNTRSRNIGRYEIVKDFLHWVKDLQMNRVLTDD